MLTRTNKFKIVSASLGSASRWVAVEMAAGERKQGREKRGGGPGRSASLCPLSGMSGQPDGGRLAGRVLAYLFNPDWTKKVPVKMKKSDRIFVEE